MPVSTGKVQSESDGGDHCASRPVRNGMRGVCGERAYGGYLNDIGFMEAQGL